MMKGVSTLLSVCVSLTSAAVAPPPHDEVASFARYVVHDSSWTAMATMAAREPIMDYPFANIFSISDGPVDSSTGVPYMYLMPLELSAIDLSHHDHGPGRVLQGEQLRRAGPALRSPHPHRHRRQDRGGHRGGPAGQGGALLQAPRHGVLARGPR